ncbi:MAG: hypothetical protein COA94_02820 [Rickettsiales bacterium]|nr:MAG: hypothetical protein COA94_02820 [Rickettsiales bacterium]
MTQLKDECKTFGIYSSIEALLLKDSFDPSVDKVNKYMELDEMVAMLSGLPLEHGNIIYALMIHYNNTHEKSISVPLYNGNRLSPKRGMSFSLDDIPKGLILIISLYLKCITDL